MPITTPDAYKEELGDPDHFAHVLAHLFTPALEAAGLTVIPPAVSGAQMIHAEIIKNLEQADFVLCDLSDLNPNVFFELGIRTSLNRPVMHVRDNLTARIPFDITAINTHTYQSSLTPWSLNGEVPRLTAFIKEVISSRVSGNAMWHYFGLTKRGVPSEAGDNPVENKLDLIIRELAQAQITNGQPLTRATGNVKPPVNTSARLAKLLGPILARHGFNKCSVTEVYETEAGLEIAIYTDISSFPEPLIREIRTALFKSGYGSVYVDWRIMPSQE